jgi:hypothetical protein
MLASKLLGIKFHVKHRIDNYMRENSDEIGFEFIEKFVVNHYCSFAASFQDFMNNKRSKKRIIIVWTYYVLLWIINIRFLLLAIINEPWIWTLFADPLYILGKGNLLALLVGICGILSSIARSLLMMFENRSEFKPLLQMYSTNRNHYGLENQYYRKFCLRSKFMAKFVLGVPQRIIVYVVTIFYNGLIIKAYFDSDFEFPIVKSIFSTILLIVWANHCFALVSVGFVGFYVGSLNLKYNFRQIKDLMKRNLRSRNWVLLMFAIQRHNHYSELTLQFNKVFKYILAIIYFLSTPIFNILIYMTTYEVNSFLRILYALGAIVLSIFIFITNYISSSLSSSAHDFTSDLYPFLSNNRIIISLQYKLKICSFIEKLCGPVIGYYCYDFFPFTNYEFYKFIFYVFSNYLLMNTLFFSV